MGTFRKLIFMYYVNVRKRNSASQQTWIPLFVCCSWGPFRFYVWTAVLAASYLGLSCRPGTYSEDLNRLF